MTVMNDKFSLLKVGGVKAPRFKGHVKVILHNCRTGKNEVWEKDNIVTNALADIFENNLMGGLDFSKLAPIWSKWYGGVLCYQNAHTLNANNYWIDKNNPIIAHAGDQAPASAAIVAEDYTRGYPTQVIVGDNFVKQTWEWNSNQGNGTINGISLTHKDVGNAGIGVDSQAFRELVPFALINGDQLGNVACSLNGEKNVFTEYDDNHGLAFYIGTDGEYKSGYTKFQTNNISVQVKRVINTKVGLFDTPDASYTNVRKFTVNTSVTFYMNPSYYFDKTNKRLWLFTNATSSSTWSKSAINYTVIDCEAETELAHGSFISDTSNFAPVCQDRSSGNGYNEPNFINIVFDGTYFYFPTTNQDSWNYNSLDANAYSGYRKINRSTPSDQEQVNSVSPMYRNRGGLVNGGYVVMDGAVIRGTTAYNCASAFDCDSELFNQPDRISSFVMPMQNGGTKSRSIAASKLVNMTLFNLDDTIYKTIEKSLVIEYTLTEASPTP